MKVKEFVDKLDDAKIIEAISEAEKKSSGEICLFVAQQKVDNVLEAAQQEFIKMGMTKTNLRNGVLIYFAPLSQQFAVIGDQGIHEKCGDSFWASAADMMSKLLKEGKFTDAVVFGIRQVSNMLEQYFPRDPNDKNELPNQIIRG